MSKAPTFQDVVNGHRRQAHQAAFEVFYGLNLGERGLIYLHWDAAYTSAVGNGMHSHVKTFDDFGLLSLSPPNPFGDPRRITWSPFGELIKHIAWHPLAHLDGLHRKLKEALRGQGMSYRWLDGGTRSAALAAGLVCPQRGTRDVFLSPTGAAAFHQLNGSYHPSMMVTLRSTFLKAMTWDDGFVTPKEDSEA